MGAGLWIGKKIIFDMNGLSPSAWVIWLTIDHHVSKDGYMGNKDNGAPDLNRGYWGLAYADHDKQEIVLTQKYYAMGQFSRFIRPGDTIIHCGDDALAAYNAETGKIVVVAVNDTASDKEYSVELADFASVGEAAKVIRTSGDSKTGEQWKELENIAVADGKFTANLKANSITTFVIE
jgi:O-glycosyl hydrolase